MAPSEDGTLGIDVPEAPPVTKIFEPAAKAGAVTV
jgi:hypothetical protein